MFNVPHPSGLLHVKDKHSWAMLIIATQEIKQDIIYRRMNLSPSPPHVANPQRLVSHLDQVFRRVVSYLQYIGLLKNKQAIIELIELQKI
jgi:hypothetical protein